MRPLALIVLLLAGAMTLASCDNADEPDPPIDPVVRADPSTSAPSTSTSTPGNTAPASATANERELPAVSVREEEPEILTQVPDEEVIEGEAIRTETNADGVAVDLLRAEVDGDTFYVALRYRTPNAPAMDLDVEEEEVFYRATDGTRVDPTGTSPPPAEMVAPAEGSSVVQWRFPAPASDTAEVDLTVGSAEFPGVVVNRA